MRKVIIAVFVMFFLNIKAQEQKLPEGWDLILMDGKKAYMNTISGEVSYTYPSKAAEKPRIAEEVDPNIYHSVKKGETLKIIAAQHGITLEKIYSLNANIDHLNLQIGQEIVIGYDKSKEGKVEYKIVEDMYTNPSNNNQHFVKKGETLYSIARKNGVTVEYLKKLNNLNSNTIEIDQIIKLK